MRFQSQHMLQCNNVFLFKFLSTGIGQRIYPQYRATYQLKALGQAAAKNCEDLPRRVPQDLVHVIFRGRDRSLRAANPLAGIAFQIWSK